MRPIAPAAQQQLLSAQASIERLKEPARDFDITQVSAQLEQARIALDTAKTQPALSEIALAQARRRLEQAVVRAPFDGVVGRSMCAKARASQLQARLLRVRARRSRAAIIWM